MFQLLQGGVAESHHLLKAYRDFYSLGFKKSFTPRPQPLLIMTAPIAGYFWFLWNIDMQFQTLQKQ